jgi:hypothetical protein
LLLFVGSLPNTPSHTAVDKETIYTRVPSLVVQLVRYRPVKTGKSEDQFCREPVGTGFFIQTTKKPGNLYLVTARHVTLGYEDLYARIPFRANSRDTRLTFGLHLKKSDWIRHPNEGTNKIFPIDVAMVGIPKLQNILGAAFLHCPADCPSGEYNQLADDPEPPEDITIYGFPLKIGFELREPRPLARKGIIALTAEKHDVPYVSMLDDKDERWFFNSRVFLMDIDMFPGNSGSPVLRFPLHSYVPYLGGLVTAVNSSDRYAIGEPVSHIIELLETAITSPRAENAWIDLHAHAFPEPCK